MLHDDASFFNVLFEAHWLSEVRVGSIGIGAVYVPRIAGTGEKHYRYHVVLPDTRQEIQAVFFPQMEVENYQLYGLNVLKAPTPVKKPIASAAVATQ
jgi:hypothetical protein